MKINEIYEPSNFIDILLLHMEKYPSMVEYMQDCVNANRVLHHNTNATSSDFIVVTEDHKSPQEGTHNYFGNYFDNYFIEKFGINFRKDSIYTTLNGASSYGSPFILLPVGDYKLCYSTEVFDLYITWQKLITDIVIYDINAKGYDDKKITEIVFSVLQNNENDIKTISKELANELESSGIQKNDAHEITQDIMSRLVKELKNILSSYTTANDIGGIDPSLDRSNNEIMVVSNAYLLLNKKKILAKTGKTPISLFSSVINRYNKGERF